MKTNRLHRCPKCRARIYTVRCVLCDGYVPDVSENRQSNYSLGMRPQASYTRDEIPGIRVIAVASMGVRR